MPQTTLLVLSDNNIKDVIKHLRAVTDYIHEFRDGNKCYEFLERIQNEKVFMIISTSFDRHFVPFIHDRYEIDSIFIFCNQNEYDAEWTKDWFKIKGVYRDIKPICDALQQSHEDYEQNATSFSLVITEDDVSEQNLDRLDPMFMYTQIIKEILLEIKFERKHIHEFADNCRKLFTTNKQAQLNKVKIFEDDYSNKTPIWWYTWESFLYSMLNQALRLSNIDVIIQMGFFIADLHRQIDKLHQQQFTNVDNVQQFTVYRGQKMSNEEFERISKTKGGLISFNNFLSTSQTEMGAMKFVKRALGDQDMMGILFVMTIDPKQSTTSFASVAHESFYKDRESEILFSMHTVFRIREIKRMDDNQRLSRIDLELTNDNDKDLQLLTKRIREETFPGETGWSRLGHVLCKLSKPKEAEQICRILLQQETDESKNAWLYSRLGLYKKYQKEYAEAIRLFKKSIQIFEKYSPNDRNLVASYVNIGLVYKEKCEYTMALSYFEKGRAIQQQILPSNHPDLALSYNNIGLVYSNMGQYVNAISSYETALEIQQRILSSDHPQLAMTYSNIGLVRYEAGEYNESLLCYETALIIRQESLPASHPDLAGSYGNIGQVYSKMHKYVEAFGYFEKAVQIGEQSLPNDHPTLQKLRKDRDRVKRSC